MDIRDLPGPAHQTLAKINARHPWNHNEHFHGWILRNLPVRRSVAVDIGCGKGVLAGKLATQFARVAGIDRNAGMVAAASARLRGFPQVSISDATSLTLFRRPPMAGLTISTWTTPWPGFRGSWRRAAGCWSSALVAQTRWPIWHSTWSRAPQTRSWG
jgi:hypothetical protein